MSCSMPAIAAVRVRLGEQILLTLLGLVASGRVVAPEKSSRGYGFLPLTIASDG